MSDGDLGLALPIRKGHFVLESGHHGDLWLDLELLCLSPELIRQRASLLAAELRKYQVHVVCGPLVEGAFVGLMVALDLGVPFVYAQPCERRTDALYGVSYRVPHVHRAEVGGKRMAIVDDVINAGSAVRATFDDLRACGAEPVALAALAVLGDRGARFAHENGLGFEVLARLPNEIWEPGKCPLCDRGVPLTDARRA